MKAHQQNRFLIPTFGLLLGTCSIVAAADILLVGNPADDPNDALVAFLTTQGHTVTQEPRRDGPGNANDFDLVIISLDSNSSGFNDPGEAAAWNAVTVPIINHNTYFYKQSVWGWTTDPLQGVGGSGALLDSPYPDPDHPFLSGLEAPTGTIFSTARGARRPGVEYLLPTGSTIVATGENSTTLGIFTIDAGTLLTSPDGVTAAGNIRIGWPLAGLYDWNFINSNGEQILSNIIGTVAPEDEAPRITNTTIESGSGDLLISFSPAGTTYVLKSSNDLTSPLSVVPSTTLENTNTTIRVPAAELNQDRDFFVIELAP
ncbi:hypothetical protein V2O64_24345 (plasmid) [Verrucomicrobiaceae bacterium 227]